MGGIPPPGHTPVSLLVILTCLGMCLILIPSILGQIRKATLEGDSRKTIGLIGGLSMLILVATSIASLAIWSQIDAARFRRTSGVLVCSRYRELIDDAKAGWAAHNPGTIPPTWEDLVGEDKYLRRQPACPARGDYTLGTRDHPCRCSIHGALPPRATPSAAPPALPAPP